MNGEKRNRTKITNKPKGAAPFCSRKEGKRMSNVAKKYIWSFFNPAAGRVAIVTDEKDVAKAVEVYKELGYKNIDKIEFICEAYAEEKTIED
jgi:hypothetical protein